MTSEDARAANPERGMRFDDFAARIVYVVTFALGSISLAQSDLWWLLRAGSDIVHTHHVSLVERYSHTAHGRYWSNHEWLWEVIAYLLHSAGGMALLSAWTGITVAVTVWMLRQCSPATGYVVPAVLILAIPVMSVSWTVRPQVTSMLLFALTMMLLGRERYLWIPPIFLLWANLHAQVVMGGLVLGIALVVALWQHLRARTPETSRRARRLAAATVVSALATLCTPLGFRLWSYVLSANGRPGQDRISEWANAFHLLVSNVVFWVILALTVVMAVRRRARLRTWANTVPLVATVMMTPLAILAVRNIPFFMVAVMPLLMTLLEFHTRRPPGRVPHARSALTAVGAVCALCVAAVWVADPPNLGWHPVHPALARALRDCPGPLYNDYNEGAALIWWVPEVKVFVDNRQDPYPKEIMDASIGLDVDTYAPVFERYAIGCAFVPQESPLRSTLEDVHWRTTYSDGSSVVLVPGAVGTGHQ